MTDQDRPLTKHTHAAMKVLEIVRDALPEERAGRVWTASNTANYLLRELFEQHLRTHKKPRALVEFLWRHDYEDHEKQRALISLLSKMAVSYFAENNWLGDRTAQHFAVSNDTNNALLAVFNSQELGSLSRKIAKLPENGYIANKLHRLDVLNLSTAKQLMAEAVKATMEAMEDAGALANVDQLYLGVKKAYVFDSDAPPAPTKPIADKVNVKPTKSKKKV